MFPSGANFLLFRPAGDGHVLWERLVEQGVLVRDFSRWPRLDDCLRVTIGTPEENDTFLDARSRRGRCVMKVAEAGTPERNRPT